VQRAHHAERREVDADDLQPGLLRRGDHAVDQVAAHRDDDDAGPRAGGRLDAAERLEVEHGVVHRHRDVVRRLGAHELLEQLGIVDRRHVERAHHDPLVGDAEAHLGAELGVGEQLAQLLGERQRIGDLAVAHDAGAQVGDRALRHCDGAIDRDLGGRDMARVELETDDRVLAAA
jgi:hypothetical protein